MPSQLCISNEKSGRRQENMRKITFLYYQIILIALEMILEAIKIHCAQPSYFIFELALLFISVEILEE